MMEDNETAEKAVPRKRDEWEIKEDIRATKRFFEIHEDKPRLEEMQEMIKAQRTSEKALDAIADGDLQKAIGFIGK